MSTEKKDTISAQEFAEFVRKLAIEHDWCDEPEDYARDHLGLSFQDREPSYDGVGLRNGWKVPPMTLTEGSPQTISRSDLTKLANALIEDGHGDYDPVRKVFERFDFGPKFYQDRWTVTVEFTTEDLRGLGYGSEAYAGQSIDPWVARNAARHILRDGHGGITYQPDPKRAEEEPTQD